MQVSKYAIYNYLQRVGISSNRSVILTPLDKKLIKDLYLDGKTIQYIHKNYFEGKCSEENINYILKQIGITRRNGIQAKLNHNYFSIIDTEEKAYFIGLLLADGSVRHNKEKGESYSIRLELKYEDKYMIEKLTSLLESDNPVKEYKSDKSREGWKEKHNAYNTFNSTLMFNDLSKYGIIPNKTLKIQKIPDIRESLMHHLIRGYFDGDGTVYITKRDKKLHYGFYGTYNFISNIKEYLMNVINISNNKITKQKNADVSFVAFSRQEDIKNFYSYIYNNATIYLIRKKKIFDDYLNNN